MKKSVWAVLLVVVTAAYMATVGKIGYWIGMFFGEKLFG